MRGLVGHPLGHSYSKIIHEKFIKKEYSLYDLKIEELDKILKEKQFDAFNVTIPYKETVIKYLDEVTDIARDINAVNCIKNRDGKLIGHNTDYDGFLWLLKNNGINLDDKTIAVLGSGGSSKAVLKAVESFNVKKIYKVSRSKKNDYITYDELYEKTIDCVINTTPVGMFPDIDHSAIDVGKINGLTIVIDIIYNPFRSKLVVDALDLGIKAIGGIEMLISQAKSAVEFFDELRIDDELVDRVTKEIKMMKQNLVFIGMPGCGKTTISKIIAKKFNLSLIELDEMIEKEANLPIKDIFAKFGEAKFRQMESNLIKRMQTKTNTVISCGGGVIKNSENIKYLRKNGFIIFLDRSIEKIEINDDRPLSKTKNDLQKLYNERIELYKKYSDLIIDNNSVIEDVINKIESEINL